LEFSLQAALLFNGREEQKINKPQRLEGREGRQAERMAKSQWPIIKEEILFLEP
jgi:hypothetical protein